MQAITTTVIAIIILNNLNLLAFLWIIDQVILSNL